MGFGMNYWEVNFHSGSLMFPGKDGWRESTNGRPVNAEDYVYT